MGTTGFHSHRPDIARENRRKFTSLPGTCLDLRCKLFYFRSMGLRYPVETYTPLSEEEARYALNMAVRLHLHRLPQLKGKGKVVDVQKREMAARYFSDSLFDQLRLSNTVLFKGPPTPLAPSNTKEQGEK